MGIYKFEDIEICGLILLICLDYDIIFFFVIFMGVYEMLKF